MTLEIQACPKCGSKDNVERVRCLCMSCPPYVCRSCKDPNDYGGYEFFDYCEKCKIDYYDCECPE